MEIPQSYADYFGSKTYLSCSGSIRRTSFERAIVETSSATSRQCQNVAAVEHPWTLGALKELLWDFEIEDLHLSVVIDGDVVFPMLILTCENRIGRTFSLFL